MNDNQTNRFEMAQATLGVLDAHADVWNGIPDAVRHRDRLAALLDGIRDAAQRQADPTEAATEAKAALRTDVWERTYKLAGAVRSWALTRDMADLAARVRAPKTELRKLRDLALAERSELVVQAAREHLAGDDGLEAAAGVTAAEVDALDAADDAFAEALSTPRAAIAEQARATGDIAAGLSAVSALLDDHLDPLVDRFEDDAPDFADAYERARVVVDRGE